MLYGKSSLNAFLMSRVFETDPETADGGTEIDNGSEPCRGHLFIFLDVWIGEAFIF